MQVTEMKTEHAPGWVVDNGAALYRLWAPRSDRDYWTASFDRGAVGGNRQAVSAVDALACMPVDMSGSQARTTLARAAAAWERAQHNG